MARRVFITVGEASGDQHASLLIRELKAMDKDIIVEGIGGPAMAEAGAMVHYDTVQRAAMGWKVIFRYFELSRILKWSRNHFREHRPDLVICIDSWTMNWHWAKLAHRMNIAVMYYVAPQVWASRPGRVKRVRRYVDRVACILPFEEKFFLDRGVEATFVGHPLFDELPTRPANDPEPRFPNRPAVIGLIAGSRSGVAKENFGPILEVADRIVEDFPNATFLVPTMPATHDVVMRFLENRGLSRKKLPGGLETLGRFTVGLNKFNEMVPRCDLCISVSGTATLHAAGYGTPQIVVYHISPIVWHLAARWLVKTRTYSLVNLLSDSRHKIVPEFIPWYGSTQPVSKIALEYLHNPALLTEQSERMRNLMRALNRPGASRNAARLAIDLMMGRATTQHGSMAGQ